MKQEQMQISARFGEVALVMRSLGSIISMDNRIWLEINMLEITFMLQVCIMPK
jgi:hypothetical protein